MPTLFKFTNCQKCQPQIEFGIVTTVIKFNTTTQCITGLIKALLDSKGTTQIDMRGRMITFLTDRNLKLLNCLIPTLLQLPSQDPNYNAYQDY